MKHKIAISWISYVWFMFSVKWVASWAKWAGYEALQGGPTRGIPIENAYFYLKDVHDLTLPIELYEGVWGDDPTKWDLLEKLTFENGAAAEARFQGLKAVSKRYISHKSQGRELIEAHPDLFITPSELADHCARTGSRIVLDTYHIRRQFFWRGVPEGVNGEAILRTWADWRTYIELLLPYIDVVHVQPMRGTDELWRWLRYRENEDTELNKILDHVLIYATANRKSLTFVIELAPPASLVSKLFWALRIKWIAREARRALYTRITEHQQ